MLQVSLDASWVRLWLATDQIERAKRWADAAAQASAKRSEATEADALRRLAIARVRLAQDEPDAALAILAPLTEATPSRLRLEARVLKALAHRSRGAATLARATLREVVAQAAVEGDRRLLLDEAPTAALLRDLQRADLDPTVARYVNALLADVADEREAKALTPAEALIEPLTDRELEVLALLAEGRTNREIAETLVVATGTVKAHTAAIYRKLDVHNRTEAAARGRELGLV
jgi:LuxR family maltose regulon positive regulatory protein